MNPRPIPTPPPGSSLRNTDFIHGIAVFTGHDTKVFMNARRPKSKRSTIERRERWPPPLPCGARARGAWEEGALSRRRGRESAAWVLGGFALPHVCRCIEGWRGRALLLPTFLTTGPTTLQDDGPDHLLHVLPPLLHLLHWGGHQRRLDQVGSSFFFPSKTCF